MLLRLTTNLINFERADTYGGKLRVAEYELGAYLEETLNIFREYAKVKRIALTYEKNFDYLNVWIDKDKMDSILKNLLSNALKYTAEEGSVVLEATETAEQWTIEVKDTGIGVPAAEQRKLFRMHFRGSNAVNAKITGSGIGLLLVWKLVRLHKGKLSFNSTEGQGSTVRVSFPKNRKAYRKATFVDTLPNRETELPPVQPEERVEESPTATVSPNRENTEEQPQATSNHEKYWSWKITTN